MLPAMPADDRSLFATGICTGLAAALRYLEAKQLEDDEESDYDG